MPGVTPNRVRAMHQEIAANAKPRRATPPKLVPAKETLAKLAAPVAGEPADVFQSFRLAVDAITYHLPSALNDAHVAANGFVGAVK